MQESALSILERSFRPIEVPSRPYVGCQRCGTAVSGVYLLIDGDEVVYVGSSTDIISRIYKHDAGRRREQRDEEWRFGKKFDRVICLSVPLAVHPAYEGALIRALKPRYSAKCPVDSAHDAEILYGLGLRSDLTTDDIDWQEVA